MIDRRSCPLIPSRSSVVRCLTTAAQSWMSRARLSAGAASGPEPGSPYLRPVALFGNKDADPKTMNVHENCPRNPHRPGNPGRASRFGQDFYCLEDLGCRGPNTYADCPLRKWNHGEQGPANWCVDSNGMCIGCVEPDFPGGSFNS